MNTNRIKNAGGNISTFVRYNKKKYDTSFRFVGGIEYDGTYMGRIVTINNNGTKKTYLVDEEFGVVYRLVEVASIWNFDTIGHASSEINNIVGFDE